MTNKTDLSLSKNQIPFNFKSEIDKINISVPLTELVTQDVYKFQVLKALNIEENNDSINLNDDHLALLFGPKIEGKFQEGVVPPFYVSLNNHDKILHNAMHDSGASHNLMPKVIMEKLDLEITRPYKDLYSFYSSRVNFMGLIKDICVNLTQIPAKCMVMDVVVADVPPKYGMLLSRSWGAKLQGTMQMDMTYATIPVFSQLRRLYRESHMKFMVSSQEKSENSPLYSVHIDLDSFILYNDESFDELELESEKSPNITKNMEGRDRKGEDLKKFAKSENYSKQNREYEKPTVHQLSANHESQEERPQLHEKFKEQYQHKNAA